MSERRLPFKVFCLALSTLLVGGASILLKIDPSKSILFKNTEICEISL